MGVASLAVTDAHGDVGRRWRCAARADVDDDFERLGTDVRDVFECFTEQAKVIARNEIDVTDHAQRQFASVQKQPIARIMERSQAGAMHVSGVEGDSRCLDL